MLGEVYWLWMCGRARKISLILIRNVICSHPSFFQDLNFTDEKCLYLVFPIKGGIINYVSKKIRKHERTPAFSTERICIRPCSKFGVC